MSCHIIESWLDSSIVFYSFFFYTFVRCSVVDHKRMVIIYVHSSNRFKHKIVGTCVARKEKLATVTTTAIVCQSLVLVLLLLRTRVGKCTNKKLEIWSKIATTLITHTHTHTYTTFFLSYWRKVASYLLHFRFWYLIVGWTTIDRHQMSKLRK